MDDENDLHQSFGQVISYEQEKNIQKVSRVEPLGSGEWTRVSDVNCFHHLSLLQKIKSHRIEIKKENWRINFEMEKTGKFNNDVDTITLAIIWMKSVSSK